MNLSDMFSPGRFHAINALFPSLSEAVNPNSCDVIVIDGHLDARWSDDETLAACTANVKRMRAGGVREHVSRFEALAEHGARSPTTRFMDVWSDIFKSNVFFTNPGVCPSDLRTFGENTVVDYVTFPQLFAPADVMFVFSTFRGRLRVLAVYDEAVFASRFQEEIFRPFLAKLAEITGVELSGATSQEGFVASWTHEGEPAVSSRDRAASRSTG